MSDFYALALAASFVAGSWLLIVLCDRLMGGKS